MKPVRVICVSAVLGLSTLSAVERAAQGQWAVVDAGNITQSITIATNTYNTVQNTLTQIERLKDQINNQLQTLKSIDPTTFSGLKALLQDGKITYDMLRQDVDSIGYKVSDVNRNFTKLFPKKQSDWKNVRYSDFDGYRDNWRGEITSATLAASRAQSSVSSLDKNNQKIIDLLDASNSSTTGEVRQLQLINQQLALIHTGIMSLVQNLATTGRVLTDMAAAATGEKMANREAALRRTQNYTDRGQTPQRLQTLP